MNDSTEKKLLLIGCPGGGQGKTTAALSFVDWLLYHDCPVKLLDAEVENKKGGMLSSFFPSAKRIDISTRGQLDEALRAVFGEERLALCDLGAATGPTTLSWFARIKPLLQRQNIIVVLIAPITASPASVSSLLEWSNSLQNTVQYLIVKNAVHGGDFGSFDCSEGGKAFSDLYHPHVIHMGQRWDVLQAELEARHLSIGTALRYFAEGDHLHELGDVLSDIVNISHLELYQEEIFTQLDQIHNFLLP